MVQRLQVLLGFSAQLFLSFGCAPETLKIHVPPTGVQSVNQEDLRRAYWALEQGADPVEWWSRRVTQFHIEMIDGCWQHTDQSDKLSVVIANKTPMQLTIMASLAKAVDRTLQQDLWQFCLLEPLHEPIGERGRQQVDLTSHDSPVFTDVNFTLLKKDIQTILKGEMGLH